MRIGWHVVKRSLLTSECACVLELCHQSDILHHGGIVWMGGAAEATTSLTTVAIMLWIVLRYVVIVTMLW